MNMSIEITLYTKSATKKKLVDELLLHNFYRADGIFDSSNDSNGFMWFETKNYESFVGVEANVRKATEEEREKYNCSEWILHTRTRSSGSQKDKEKQNIIIKHIRKLFGGTFYNDWYGANIYTNLIDYPELTAPERGFYLMQNNIHNKISSLQYSLKHMPDNLLNLDLDKLKNDKSYLMFLKSIEPSLVVYNAMFPFLVSLIEFMFKESFLIMIRYDNKAQGIIAKENIKVPLDDVFKISSGKMLIEEVIAGNFTFQNLGQVNKAYKTYLNIDIAKILSKKRKVGNNFYRVYQEIEDIIQIRHSIIHHFGFYTDINKEKFINSLKTIEIALEMFLQDLEERYKWSINV
jgi:hypothetical protein